MALRNENCTLLYQEQPFVDLEDFMTLHVGMIGTDGFVIASDMLRVNMSPGTLSNPQRSSVPKIFCKDGLVWACSGFNPHAQFGDELLEEPTPAKEYSKVFLEDFAKCFFRNRRVEKQNQEILFGNAGDPLRLWQVKAYTDRQRLPKAEEIRDHATNEQPVCAHFIPNLFHNSEDGWSVDELVFPAALTIWYGGRESSGTIGGLQLVTCIRGQLTEMDPRGISSLQSRCAEFHKRMEKEMRHVWPIRKRST
jgi:hypothetical protein